jgi:alkylation response protein AidB-like acyl-CoA dehydrogenase
MDFSPAEAGTDLAGLTKDILSRTLTPQRLRDIESGVDRIDRTLWTDLAAAGVLSAALPESVGGGGYGLLEQCAVLVELGRAVAPVPYLDSIVVAASAVARFGTPEQRARWAEPAASGELVLTAALDASVSVAPGSGSGPAFSVVAEEVDGGWRLTGTLAAVPSATIADAILVPSATKQGAVGFMVLTGEAGVAVTPVEVVDLGAVGRVELEGVVVPSDRVLAGTSESVSESESSGTEVVESMVTAATVGRCALQLGIVEQALALTAEHARTRVQFDRPIATFQAVAQRLADAYVDVEAVRLTLWQAAWRVAEGLPARAEVATAKFWASDAGHRVAHTAVHIHGGMGIDTDHPLHRYFTAAKRQEFESGGATAQLLRLGDLLAAAAS